MKQFFTLVSLLFYLAACSDGDQSGAEIKADPERIFYDYQVWAEEGRRDVMIRLQYRRGGEAGEPIVLEEPSRVSLDGVLLPADSTRFMGPYYEVAMPAEEFTGKHTIVYVDSRKKEQREEFTFSPFTMKGDLPERLRKKPFEIQLKNFPAALTTIRLVMTDTSHITDDVNDEMTIKHGLISVTEEQLANLVLGPITLEIFKEEERPIGSPTEDGGKFAFTYGLRRQFELVK